jgi:hypothetical protein
MTRKPNKSVAVAGAPPLPSVPVVGAGVEEAVEPELGENEDDDMENLERAPLV